MLVGFSAILLQAWGISVFAPPADALTLSLPSPIEASNADNLNVSNVAAFGDNCFDASFAPRLFPAVHQDCIDASQQILKTSKNVRGWYVFSRSSKVQFQLPWVARNGTCVISLDVANDDDKDKFMPWTAYLAALSLANVCVNNEHRLGGKLIIGPHKVVTLMVFGRMWPAVDQDEGPRGLPMGVAEPGSVVAREGNNSRTRALDASQYNLTSQETSGSPGIDTGNSSVLQNLSNASNQVLNTNAARSNATTGPQATSLGGIPVCWDPPTQREIANPINISDCEKAAIQIIGDRDKYDQYIFSRRKVWDPFYYPMPARFTHGSCVVSLDMENDSDQDRVRVAYVESSAWVLAHKCSGEELPQFKYGGSMTVGVGANDLIRVWVYDIGPLTSDKAPILSLSQNQSLIEVQ